MTFKEMRERLANRDAIREKQEEEERLEAEREKEEERLKRQDSMSTSSNSNNSHNNVLSPSNHPVLRKAQDKFIKEVSKVIVRELDPYQRPDVARGRIKSRDDFKHLAKKVAKLFIITLFVYT